MGTGTANILHRQLVVLGSYNFWYDYYDARTAMISWTSDPVTSIADEHLAMNRR